MMFTQIHVMFTYYRDGRVKTVTNQEAGKSMLTINMRYCTELQPNTEQLNYNTWNSSNGMRELILHKCQSVILRDSGLVNNNE